MTPTTITLTIGMLLLFAALTGWFMRDRDWACAGMSGGGAVGLLLMLWFMS